MNYLKLSLRSLLLFVVLICKLSDLHAQVLVNEEPRHRPVFQNDQIRILNVLVPPGDTTQYHIHHTPSVFIFFTSTATGSQLQGASALTSKSTAGNILFEDLAPPHIRVHRVWNEDKDTLHVMDVELLSKDTGFIQKPMNMQDLKLEIDAPWVRAYRLTLLKGNDFILSSEKRSFIFVSFNATTMQTKQSGKTQYQTLKQGSFFVIKRRRSLSLKNTSDHTVQFVLLELPAQ